MTEPICEVIITAGNEDWLISFTRSSSRTGSSPADSTSTPIRSSIAGTAKSMMITRLG